MSRRLALGLLLLLPAAEVAWASPAGAAMPSGRWTDPAPTESFEDIPLAYQEAPGPLRGFAEFDGEIQNVTFTVVRDGAERPDDPCSASQAVQPQTAPGGARRVEWAFEAPFPCNRRYQVRATVTPRPRTLEQDTPLVLNLWVDVAVPSAPADGVTAVAGEDRTVRVSWSAPDQAPDFEGYQVRRSVRDAAPEVVGEVEPGVSELVDTELPPQGGRLRYEVVGMRPGPGDTTVFSAPARSDLVLVEPLPSAADSDDGTTVDTGSGSDRGGSTAGNGTAPTRVRQSFRGPTPRRVPARTRTTIDTGFAQTLPFAPGDAPVPPPEEEQQQQALPTGDPAVVARIPEDDETSRRDTMLLVAGGAAAASWALLLRLVTRRALVL